VVFNVQTEAPPLNEDASGALRVGGSRVLLEIVVRAFRDGATPETIVQRYSTLELPDVYAVLAYYLRHSNEVEEYLAKREQKAEQVRQRIKRAVNEHCIRLRFIRFTNICYRLQPPGSPCVTTC